MMIRREIDTNTGRAAAVTSANEGVHSFLSANAGVNSVMPAQAGIQTLAMVHLRVPACAEVSKPEWSDSP